ncbi:MAG: hypothetical protein WA857_19350 [Candidatus Acidiferrum sp.]
MRTDKAKSKKNIQDADTADGAAKRRIKHQANENGKVNEEEVRLPISRPWEIEKHGPHFEANNDQQCAQDAVHG